MLDPDDPDQRELRQELFGDPTLWDEVSARLGAVGFELVQMLGHLGVRMQRSSAVAPLITSRNNLGLDARHVRVLVHLWVQLLYRQLKETLREEAEQPRGVGQTLLGLQDEDPVERVPTLPVSELFSDLSDQYAKSTVTGAITTLKRTGFVRESAGELSAGPAMYVYIDHERMEEHVVGLARRGETSLPELP